MDDMYSLPLPLLRRYIAEAYRNDFRAVAKLTELFGSVDDAEQFLASRIRTGAQPCFESTVMRT